MKQIFIDVTFLYFDSATGRQPTVTQNTYLTQSEAADFLRISERTLERWRVEGNGPRFRRFGRRVVYSKADLEIWADGRCYQSTSATEPLSV